MKYPEVRPKWIFYWPVPVSEVQKIIFGLITKDLIQKASMRTKGAVGPSKFETDD